MKMFLLGISLFVGIQSGLMASELTTIEGFVSRHEDLVYASTNFYFSKSNIDFRIEDFSGLQSFKIINNDLYLQLKSQQAIRIGEVDINVKELKDKERVRIRIIEDIEVETIFEKIKSPKTERYLSCGITGCGIGKRAIERTQRVISLRIHNGNEFCFYQNRPDKLDGVLYPEKCIK
ncbi:MAG: hypothetical protein WC635_11575 [Bacteriovorax sp.]|jgi:hypothetical protein